MYNKLFTSILDSSIWLEDDGVIRIWVTLLASMDETGFCKFGSIHNLARRANKTPKETARCVEILESPDKVDPHQEFEGRRIERVESGWMVLNAGKYRDMATRQIAMEKTRLRVHNFRARKKGEPELPLLPRQPRHKKESGIDSKAKIVSSREDALLYWRRQRDKGTAAYKDCPSDIKKELET